MGASKASAWARAKRAHGREQGERNADETPKALRRLTRGGGEADDERKPDEADFPLRRARAASDGKELASGASKRSEQADDRSERHAATRRHPLPTQKDSRYICGGRRQGMSPRSGQARRYGQSPASPKSPPSAKLKKPKIHGKSPATKKAYLLRSYIIQDTQCLPYHPGPRPLIALLIV